MATELADAPTKPISDTPEERSVSAPLMTVDQFLEQADTEGLELINGRVEKKPTSELTCFVGPLVMSALVDYSRTHGGRAFQDDTEYRCFGDRRLRKPDASWIAADRLSPLKARVVLEIPPDLAVEVISPGDTIDGLDTKLDDYAAAGVRMVWIVKPLRRTVEIIDHTDGSRRLFAEADTLDGGSVLPGFARPVADLLPDPCEVEPPPEPTGDE